MPRRGSFGVPGLFVFDIAGQGGGDRLGWVAGRVNGLGGSLPDAAPKHGTSDHVQRGDWHAHRELGRFARLETSRGTER